MTSTADLELAMIRMVAAYGGCGHEDAMPVESSVTGEILAALCPSCDRQLPAAWLTEVWPARRKLAELGLTREPGGYWREP